MPLPSLSIAIGSYNDAESVRPLVDEAAEWASRIARQFRVLVVDDGSSDGSPDVLRGLARERDWLECRYHAKNLGFGPTFSELYLYDRCEFNAILPGDGQIAPSQIAGMAEAIEDADVVLGLRSVRQDSFRRRANSALYNTVVSAVAGRSVRDVNSISIARTSFVRGIELRGASAFIHAEFLLECLRRGGRVREIEIVHRPRSHGAGQGGRLRVILPTIGELCRYTMRGGVVWGRGSIRRAQ